MSLFGFLGGGAAWDINKIQEYMGEAPSSLLIDVREPDEYASGHIPGSRNIPVGQISGRHQEIGGKDAAVYVYCQSGMRSSKAAKTLKTLGFQDVRDLGGIGRYRGKLEK